MFTLRSHRQRRGPYGLSPSEDQPSRLLRTVAVLIATIAVLYAARSFWQWIRSGNIVQRAAATMTVEAGGPVSFSIEGGSLRRAEDTLKLAEGDRVETGAGGRAQIAFFDESHGLIDESSTLSIEESAKGSEVSILDLKLAMGGLWLRSSAASTLSGSILRRIETPAFKATVPNNAEILIRNRSIDVFAADGLGVEVLPEGASASIFIGEGQRWALPPDADMAGDLYVFRSALPTDAAAQPIVTRGRLSLVAAANNATTPLPSSNTEVLVVTTPQNNAKLAGATVRVEGRVSALVSRVRVNGYQAVLDGEKHTFLQDLAFGSETPFILHIEAMDSDNMMIGEEQRSVTRDTSVTSTALPTITEPAVDGSTYRTQATEIIVKGTAPKTVEGIIVNDYRLQLYEPGSGTWSYLASTQLGNLKAGENTFDVIAIDAAGNKSPAVRLIILVEEGSEGIIGGASSATSAGMASSSPAVVEDETTLPKNAPLAAGSLAVTGPGLSPFTTGSGEILIEGTTSAETDSMWVNGYRLRLYLPGKITWNYIASTQYGTLKRGSNTYRVNARNAKGEIVDKIEYVVRYESQ